MADSTNLQLEIARPENLQSLSAGIGNIYSRSVTAKDRCIASGQQLLAEAQQGMTDDLDQRIKDYIDKSRTATRKINELRAPFTRLFDDCKRQFTEVENSIDPTKADTPAFRLQQLRNKYAAQKRDEEERQRREAQLRQQHDQIMLSFRSDVSAAYDTFHASIVKAYVDRCIQIYNSFTLDDYERKLVGLRDACVEFPREKYATYRITLPVPAGLTSAECQAACSDIIVKKIADYEKDFLTKFNSARDQYVAMFPSRRGELERAANAATEEERKQIEADIMAHQQAEQQRIEQQRMEEQQRIEQQRADDKQQQDLLAAFGHQAVAEATPSGYQPKSSVKRRIEVLTPDGIEQIISLWWAREGRNMPLDELTKQFKKQITFCEKLANAKNESERVTINNPSIRYIDEVKAK